MPFSESLKVTIRKRSHYACCLCKNIGIEIHHIQPQEEDGADTDDNAAPLCPTCHEIYGANPTKRKMITEARDLWYEICAARYKSDADRLTELLQEVSYLKSHVVGDGLAQLVASKVATILAQQSNNAETKDNTGWQLSKLLEKVASFPTEYPVPKGIDLIFQFLFKTRPEDNQECRDFNTVRDRFFQVFGSYVAYCICVYLGHELPMDFDDGVTEMQFAKLEQRAFIVMVILLSHAAVAGRDYAILETRFENGKFVSQISTRPSIASSAARRSTSKRHP